MKTTEAPIKGIGPLTTPVDVHQTMIGNNNILYGTCEVEQGFGTVISSTLKRANEKQEWEDCRGNTRLILLRNKRYEVEMEVEFDPSVTLPVEGDSLAFPHVGVTGQILNWDLVFAKADCVKLKITATHWDSLGDSPTVAEITTGS